MITEEVVQESDRLLKDLAKVATPGLSREIES